MLRFSLRYDCGADGTAAFDFLTGYERDVGSEPALTLDGLADATILVPDDPAISFDDEDREANRLFQLWVPTSTGRSQGRRRGLHAAKIS